MGFKGQGYVKELGKRRKVSAAILVEGELKPFLVLLSCLKIVSY